MATDHPLSPGGITHALLDANVLLPPRLSDVIFDLCLEGLFSARWSVEIEAEFLRHWPLVVARAAKSGAVRYAPQNTIEQAKGAAAIGLLQKCCSRSRGVWARRRFSVGPGAARGACGGQACRRRRIG